MVNLKDVRTGDRLAVEVTVCADDVFDSVWISANCYSIADKAGNLNPKVKVLEHKPKPIEEPAGTGAVVKVKSRVNGNMYNFVKAPNDNPSYSWVMSGHMGLYSWREVVKDHDIVEILSPGVEVDNPGVDTNG